jgi:cytochrome c6
MSEIDDRLARFKFATQKVVAPEALKKQLVSKVRAAAALPVVAAIGWQVGVGVKLLIASVLLAGAGAGFLLGDGSDVSPPDSIPVKPFEPAAQEPPQAPLAAIHLPAAPGVVRPLEVQSDISEPVGTRPQLSLGSGAGGDAVASSELDPALAALSAAEPRCGGNQPIRVELRPAPRGRVNAMNGSRISALEGELRRERELLRTARLRPGGAQIPNLIVLGRFISADPAVDAGEATAWFRIYPGGWFLASIASRALPLWVTLHGHQPVELDFHSLPDGEVFVGDITLPKTTLQTSAALQVQVQPVSANLTISIGRCGPNNTVEKEIGPASGPPLPLGAQRLSLAPYTVKATAPGRRSESVLVFPESGAEVRVSLLLQHASGVFAEYLTGDLSEKRTGRGASASVFPNQPWVVWPQCPLTLREDESGLSFAEPTAWMGRGLGRGPLELFQSASDPTLWSAKCKSCHGETGAADTKTGKKEKIADMRVSPWQSEWSDEQIERVILEGSINNKKMKPFKDKLSPQELAELVQTIRRFGSTVGPVDLGSVYLLRCDAASKWLLVRFSR